jgi:hypothetical protein
VFINNGIINFNLLNDFDFDFNSIFSNINALFKDQEVSPIIKYNNSYATNPYIDASTS